MERMAQALGWASQLLAWAWLIWFSVGAVVGGVLVAFDEWRFYRTRPKPEAIRAYADQLVIAYGREAFRINGDAMFDARLAQDFDRYRFLKEVSGELVSRFFAKPDPE